MQLTDGRTQDSSERVACFALRVKWTKPEEHPVELCHRIKLLGAKPPGNFITLKIEPPSQPSLGMSSWYPSWEQLKCIPIKAQVYTSQSMLETRKAQNVHSIVKVNFYSCVIFSALPRMFQKKARSRQQLVHDQRCTMHMCSFTYLVHLQAKLFTCKPRVSLEHYLVHGTFYLLPWFRGVSLGAEALAQQYMNSTQGLTLYIDMNITQVHPKLHKYSQSSQSSTSCLAQESKYKMNFLFSRILSGQRM